MLTDSHNSSSGSVLRSVMSVATGAYDMGFADFNALVEYAAGNPDSNLQAVYMVYNNIPAAVFARKDSGIETPADLAGKTLASPVFDGGRKAWPSFASYNDLDVDSVSWESVEPAIRETLLAQGRVDGITGFYFTSLLNLEARGVDMDDITVMLYSDFDVPLYGNAIIASDNMIQNNPEAVAGFNRAFNRALYPMMIGFNSIPKVAFVPVLVVWFGIGTVPAILTAFLISFFPVLVNVATGLSTLEPELEDVLRSMGASKIDILRKVGLPRTMPYFFASLKVAITLAFVGSVISETVASNLGIGYLMMAASSSMDMGLVFAGLIVIGAMGVGMYELFAFAEKRFTGWATRGSGGAP